MDLELYPYTPHFIHIHHTSTDEAIDIHTGSEQGGIEFAAAVCVACAREPSA